MDASARSSFLRDFAGDLRGAKAKVTLCGQERSHKAMLAGKRGDRRRLAVEASFYAVSTEDGRSIPI